MSDLTGPTPHEFLRVEGGNFITVSSLSEAQITKINIFRKNYNTVTAVTPHFTQANVWVMIGGKQGRSGSEIIAAEYHYLTLDEKVNGTYPLKTVQQAWEELKSGKGYIANFGDNPSAVIGIRKIYLAYYDAGQYVPFYQPVFVFEGDNKFAAYVPAGYRCSGEGHMARDCLSRSEFSSDSGVGQVVRRVNALTLQDV